jgi:hypothetical protein
MEECAMGASRPRILRSDGAATARVYATIAVPETPAAPPVETERVIIIDPRRVPTRTGPPKSSGPRAQEQMRRAEPKPPGIELPDRRPLMKTQRIWIDAELLEQWEKEEDERRKQGA